MRPSPISDWILTVLAQNRTIGVISATASQPLAKAPNRRSGTRSRCPSVTRCSSRCAPLEVRYPPIWRMASSRSWVTQGRAELVDRRGCGLPDAGRCDVSAAPKTARQACRGRWPGPGQALSAARTGSPSSSSGCRPVFGPQLDGALARRQRELAAAHCKPVRTRSHRPRRRHLRQRPRYPWRAARVAGRRRILPCARPAAHTRPFTTIVPYWFPMRTGPVQPPAEVGILNGPFRGAVKISSASG